jgi:hypothetical protein
MVSGMHHRQAGAGLGEERPDRAFVADEDHCTLRPTA